MRPKRTSLSIHVVPLVLLLAMAGCGRGTPTTSVWISGVVPQCPSSSSCDVFEGGQVPAAVTEALARPDAGSAELVARTGVTWTRQKVPADPLFVDLHAAVGDTASDVAAWVVETVTLGAPETRLISVASHGGMALWVNGRRIARSRYPVVGATRHSEVARVDLSAGTNIIAYRVNQGWEDWKLYREWWSPDRERELLGLAIDAAGFADLLPRAVDEDARFVHFKPATVYLGDTPEVRLRWANLLGGHPGEWKVFRGSYPDSLALPAGFDGSALLELEVRDPDSGRRLYYEDTPLLTQARAVALARQLLALPGGRDPVLTARRDLVREVFQSDSAQATFPAWIWAQALTDLLRIVRDPEGYPRYSGAQVWGYRLSETGPVIPYWLFVPPGMDAGTGVARPLVFSVNHLTNPDFWHGRGAQPGFPIEQVVMAGSHGTLGVIPHLGGLTNIADIGARELPAITAQVASVLPVDTSRVGLMVWSFHAGNALRLAVDPNVTIGFIGMAVPDLSIEDRARSLDLLKERRPDLRVLVWGGADDHLMTPARVEEEALAMEWAGAKVTYVNVPHSTHLSGLLYDVEGALRTAMGAPTPADFEPPTER